MTRQEQRISRLRSPLARHRALTTTRNALIDVKGMLQQLSNSSFRQEQNHYAISERQPIRS
jgi:hypothetical protein